MARPGQELQAEPRSDDQRERRDARHVTGAADFAMVSLALRRTAFSLFSLLVVSLVLFILTRSIPTSPAHIVLGDQATEEQIAQFDRDHGLDRPIVVQYLIWLRRLVVNADLGHSFTT